jgi:membrane fusion protein (multidrug efflux system)
VNFTGKVAAVDARVDTDTRNIQVRASFRNPGHKLLPGMYTRVTIETGKPQRYLTLPDTAITYNPYGETVFVVMTQAEFDAQQKAAAAEGGDNRETEPGTAKMAPAKAKAPATVAAASAPGAQQALVVRQVFVTVGPKRGDQVAILNGLKAGDQVVTTGQLKLKSGTEVEINNAVQPSDQPNPKPLEH